MYNFLDYRHQTIKRILLGVQERERLLAQVKEDNAEISVMERHIADMGDRWALIGPQLHSAQLSLVHSCTILTSHWSTPAQYSALIGPQLHTYTILSSDWSTGSVSWGRSGSSWTWRWRRTSRSGTRSTASSGSARRRWTPSWAPTPPPGRRSCSALPV